VRAGLVERVLKADERQRQQTQLLEVSRAAQNAASKAIGKSTDDERSARIAEATRLKEQVSRYERLFHAADVD
jgi:seryl-tRNA synthetase